jgi:hypothetical protein
MQTPEKSNTDGTSETDDSGATDTLTLLQVEPGKRATKAHTWTGSEWRTDGYDQPTYFRPTTREVAGIYELADLVQQLESAREWFAVRGQLTDADPCIVRDGCRWVRRNLRAKDADDARCSHEGDECPTHLRSHPDGRRWLMIDIDDMPAPAGAADDPTPGELRDLVRFAVGQLPDAFDGATTAYQWSASAGVKGWDKLRLHLWFWLSRPAYDTSIRHWLKAQSEASGTPIDWHLYNAVQPHYTAAPVFRNASDPLADHRSGVIEGDRDTVELPDAVLTGEEYREKRERERREREKRREAAQKRNEYRTQGKIRNARERYASRALDRACDEIRSAAKGHRHDTIYTEAAAMGGLVAGGHLDGATARQRLVDAMRDVLPPKRQNRDGARTIHEALEVGKESPRYLEGIEPRDRRTSRQEEQRDSKAPRADENDGGVDNDREVFDLDDLPDLFGDEGVGDSDEPSKSSDHETDRDRSPDAAARPRPVEETTGDEQTNDDTAEQGHEHRERLRGALRELVELPADDRALYRALAYEADAGPQSEGMTRFETNWSGWGADDLRREHERLRESTDTPTRLAS